MRFRFLSATLLLLVASSVILGADQETKVKVLAPEVGVTTAKLRYDGLRDTKFEEFKGYSVFFDRDKTGAITAIRVRDDQGFDKVYPASEIVSVSFQSQCALDVTERAPALLKGRWAAYSKYGSKRADCEIHEEQGKLEFVLLRNPPERSPGRFIDAQTVVAEAWGQEKGKVSSDRKRIDWTDSYWLKVE